jgi:hypothetical protein
MYKGRSPSNKTPPSPCMERETEGEAFIGIIFGLSFPFFATMSLDR